MPNDLLLWLDSESTGLDPQRDSLLSVAGLLTTPTLEVLPGSTFNFLIKHPAHLVRGMKAGADPFVRTMHERTGLWDMLIDAHKAYAAGTPAVPLEDADNWLTEHVKKFAPEPRQARIAGNSVRHDLNFIQANLPRLYEHLHYRVFDMTSIAFAAEYWSGVAPMPKTKNHSAMEDIKESLTEAQYVRDRAFMAQSAVFVDTHECEACDGFDPANCPNNGGGW